MPVKIKNDYKKINLEIDEAIKDENGMLICWGHNEEKYVYTCPACLQRSSPTEIKEKIKEFWKPTNFFEILNKYY